MSKEEKVKELPIPRPSRETIAKAVEAVLDGFPTEEHQVAWRKLNEWSTDQFAGWLNNSSPDDYDFNECKAYMRKIHDEVVRNRKGDCDEWS